LQQFVEGAVFEEDAVFQDKGVLAEGGGLERVVGDEQESDVRLGDELLDFTEELRLDGGVEAGEGLIEQEQPGAHGEGHTLLLADRQGGRFAPGEGIDAAGLQGGMGAGEVFGAGQAAIGQAEEDILLGGEVGPTGPGLGIPGLRHVHVVAEEWRRLWRQFPRPSRCCHWPAHPNRR